MMHGMESSLIWHGVPNYMLIQSNVQRQTQVAESTYTCQLNECSNGHCHRHLNRPLLHHVLPLLPHLPSSHATYLPAPSALLSLSHVQGQKFRESEG